MQTSQSIPTVKDAKLECNGTIYDVKLVDGPGEYKDEDKIIIVTSESNKDSFTVIKGQGNLIFSNRNHIGSFLSVVVGDNNAYWDSYPDSFCGYIFTQTEVEYSVTKLSSTTICKFYNETDTYFQTIHPVVRKSISLAKAVHERATTIVKTSAIQKKLAQERALANTVKEKRLQNEFDFPDYSYASVVNQPDLSVIASDKKVTASRVFICGDRTILENVQDGVVIGNGCEAKRSRGCIFIGSNNFDDAITNDSNNKHPSSTEKNDFFNSLEDLEKCRAEIAKNKLVCHADSEKLNLAYCFAMAAKAYAKKHFLTDVSDALYEVAAKKQVPKPVTVSLATSVAVAQSFQVPASIQSCNLASFLKYQSFMEQFRPDTDRLNSDPTLAKKLKICMDGWEVMFNGKIKALGADVAELEEEISSKLKKIGGGK